MLLIVASHPSLPLQQPEVVISWIHMLNAWQSLRPHEAVIEIDDSLSHFHTAILQVPIVKGGTTDDTFSAQLNS